MATILAENTPKLDTTSHDSQDEDSEKKVSRSGRKIKPKRFHDSIDAEISIDSSRNGKQFHTKFKKHKLDIYCNFILIFPLPFSAMHTTNFQSKTINDL